MRMTPARRDFLRLCVAHELQVFDNGGRFLHYSVPDQINRKISRRNFYAMVGAGYLRAVVVDGAFQVWEATNKARRMFPNG